MDTDMHTKTVLSRNNFSLLLEKSKAQPEPFTFDHSTIILVVMLYMTSKVKRPKGLNDMLPSYAILTKTCTTIIATIALSYIYNKCLCNCIQSHIDNTCM